MTALMSLRTRINLARVALQLPGDSMDPGEMASLVGAGVDLLILDGSGDDDADAETLRNIRRMVVGGTALVGTSSKKVAEPAAADVVHLERPGWRFWGYPKGHQWSLLGRHASDKHVLLSPGEDFDYLFVGPIDYPEAQLLRAAVEHQPPLDSDALPWFALGGSRLDDVRAMLNAGARRIALTSEILEQESARDTIATIAEAVQESWTTDERSRPYRLRSFNA